MTSASIKIRLEKTRVKRPFICNFGGPTLLAIVSIVALLHCRHVPNEAVAREQPTANQLTIVPKTTNLTAVAMPSVRAPILVAPMYNNKIFLDGLKAKPNSDARKKAAAILKRYLKNAFRKTRWTTAESTVLTKKIFYATADYLAGAGCDETAKLTFYRGISDQTLFAYKEFQSNGVFFYHGFDQAARDKTKKLKISDPIAYFGDNYGAAPDFFANLKPKSFQPGLPDTYMDWRALAEFHHQNRLVTPLIDISLSKVIANALAPNMLKIRICPHRIFPVSSNLFLAKREFYVPFFILPEEIVEVRGISCMRQLAIKKPSTTIRKAMEFCAGTDYPPTGFFSQSTSSDPEDDQNPGNLGLVTANSEMIQAAVLKDLSVHASDYPLDSATSEAKILSCMFQSEFNPTPENTGVENLEDFIRPIKTLWLSAKTGSQISSGFMHAIPSCQVNPEYYFKKLSQDWMIDPPEFMVLEAESIPLTKPSAPPSADADDKN
jgi:hypothetical protein